MTIMTATSSYIQNAAATTTTLFDDVLVNVGMHIYHYLMPRELLALGSCNHELWNNIIRDKLLQICMYHLLPLRLGVRTNYLAVFHEVSKFEDREELVEYVLDKTVAAGLVIDGTATVEESRNWAREELLNGVVHAPVSGKFIYDLSIECNYHALIGKNNALSWVKYILDRNALLPSHVDGRRKYWFFWDWLNFISSYSNDVSFGVWRWTCKGHPKIRPIAGVGVTFTIPNDGRFGDGDAAKRLNATTLEIRLTRLY